MAVPVPTVQRKWSVPPPRSNNSWRKSAGGKNGKKHQQMRRGQPHRFPKAVSKEEKPEYPGASGVRLGMGAGTEEGAETCRMEKGWDGREC